MKLKINHLSYDVLAMPEALSWGVAGVQSYYGMHNPNHSAIYIDASQPAAEQARIFLHEIIHALWNAYAIPKADRGEEDVCLALESPLAGLFRDNPHLGTALTAAFAGKAIVTRPKG